MRPDDAAIKIIHPERMNRGRESDVSNRQRPQRSGRQFPENQDFLVISLNSTRKLIWFYPAHRV
jgi:hypothetical protein